MKSLSYRLLITFCLAASCMLLFAGGIAYAQTEYQPLTGIPGVTDTEHVSLAAYVNALFILAIALGAMLAVIQIAIGGFTYMMTDVVTKKGDATARITGALLGLGILLATFIVLYTINPQLTNLNVLTGADRVNLIAPSSNNQIDNRSHDEIREQVRSANPVVDSTFTGQFGSQGHTDFVRQCVTDGGRPVLKSGSADTVECRTKNAPVPNCPEGTIVEYGNEYENGYRCGTVGGSF